MGFMDSIFGSDSKVESAPNYSPEEQALRNSVATLLKTNLNKTATAYGGKTLAETPSMFNDAVNQFSTLSDTFAQPTQDSLMQMLSGKPVFEADPTQISNQWQEMFANPAMTTWNKFVAPDIKQANNSGMFNTRSSKIVADASSKFYGESIVPALFNAQMSMQQLGVQSKENAASRQAAATEFAYSMPAQVFNNMLMVSNAVQTQEQIKLDDAYKNFLRMTQEESPWLKLATGYSGSLSDSYTTVGMQGTEGALAGALGTVAGTFGGIGLAKYAGIV